MPAPLFALAPAAIVRQSLGLFALIVAKCRHIGEFTPVWELYFRIVRVALSMRRARGGPLGNGGMGEVYLVEETLLERPIALKFLSSDLPLDSGYRFPPHFRPPTPGPPR